MRVLIQRNEPRHFTDSNGKKQITFEVVKKVVLKTAFEKAKGMDSNVDKKLQWQLVHEFKDGEKLTKDFHLEDKEKTLQDENKRLKDELAKLKKSDIDPELQKARDLYFDTFGKKPNALMKEAKLYEKIEEFKNKTEV